MHDLLAIVMTAAVTTSVNLLLSRGIGGALLALARARARRVKHVPASGSLLYAAGVPLDEEQFRQAFAAMQAELDELSPPAERNPWELLRQSHAINRFSVLAGTYPQPFPILSSADEAWNWYRANGSYVAADDEPQPVQAVFEPPGRLAFRRRPSPS